MNNKPRKIWLYLAGIAFIGSVSGTVITALSGNPIPPVSLTGVLVWSSVFFWLYWRYLEREGWQGFLMGLAVGLVLGVLAAFIAAFNKP